MFRLESKVLDKLKSIDLMTGGKSEDQNCITILPGGDMNVCTKFLDNQSNSYLDVLPK